MMGEPIVAQTQYGDLTGTVSLDGFEGSFLQELIAKSEKPKGYWPVGLEFYVEEPHAGQPELERSIGVTLLCVDATVAGVAGRVTHYVRDLAEVPVWGFDVEIELHELLELIKRLHIVVADRLLDDKPMTLIQDS